MRFSLPLPPPSKGKKKRPCLPPCSFLPVGPASRIRRVQGPFSLPPACPFQCEPAVFDNAILSKAFRASVKLLGLPFLPQKPPAQVSSKAPLRLELLLGDGSGVSWKPGHRSRLSKVLTSISQPQRHHRAHLPGRPVGLTFARTPHLNVSLACPQEG